MTREVRIGNKLVGDGHPAYIIAEVGINHNGDIENAKELILGCQACRSGRGEVPETHSRVMRSP